jgi:uncharacterized membrane protein
MRDKVLTWVLGGVEMLLSMAVAIWLLTSPALFRLYYPVLHISPHTHDAIAVVDWLSTNSRERSLGVAMQDRRLDNRELKHFSDVRRVFGHFPKAMAVLGAIMALLLLAGRGRLATIALAQKRGLICWSLLLLIIGGFAWWDWQRFFAWVHHPFFGDVSWRLPDEAYSLVMFPARFWRLAVIAVLLTPALAFGMVSGAIKLVARGRSAPPRSELAPSIAPSMGPTACR